MYINRTTSSLFAIALASWLIVATGVIGSAFAADKDKSSKFIDPTNTIADGGSEEKSSSQKSKDSKTGDPSSSLGDNGIIFPKSLKNLSKCQSGAAEDGDLTLPEVKDCYSQVFVQSQDKRHNTGAMHNNDQSTNGQEQQPLRSTSIHDPKVTAMREGFPF
jgi:hypothetical protein